MAVSFKFSSHAKPKELGKGAINDQDSITVENERDYVTSISDKKIKGSRIEVKKEAVVIPCLKDGFKVALEESMKDSLEEAAITALLKDAGKSTEDATATETTIIPAVRDDNKESDNKIARQVAVGEAADYEAVSIDDFGMAMLRGMGFSEKEGIGKTNKGLVKPVEVVVRPKGQGLGAGLSRAKMEAKTAAKRKGEELEDESEDEIVLQKGAKCMIQTGPHKEKYATVEGTDAENSRIIVRLAVGGTALSLPESSVKGVSEKEFQKYSRYLNKASAELARKETEKRLMEMQGMSTEESLKSSKHRRRSRSRSPKHKRSSKHRSRSRSRNRKHKRDKDKKHSRRDKHEQIPRWLASQLSVVVKSGKYANQRGSVGDVTTPTTCSVRLQNGKMLYDVSASDLVPVQPIRVGDACMVLLGSNSRLVGRILEVNRDSGVAVLQSVADEMIVSQELSNLCLFTGSLDAF